MKNSKKILFIFFISYITNFLFISADTINWENPSLSDLKILQEKFIKNASEIVSNIMERKPSGEIFSKKRADSYKNFRFYSEDMKEVPRFNLVKIGRRYHGKRCVVSYCSIKPSYEKHILEKIDYLKKVGYEGDYLYQIGGWPSFKGSALKLYDVPYAFKPCALKAAIEMGYKQILWIDASIQPKVSIDYIFDNIEKFGFFGHKDYLPFRHKLFEFNLKTLSVLGNYFQLNYQDFLQVKHVAAAVIGFDASLNTNKQLIDSWIKLAFDKTPFYFPDPEQLALSILVWKMKIQCSFKHCLKRNFFVSKH